MNDEERLEMLRKETNDEATARIGRELKAEKKEVLRKDAVYNMFFILTGQPMTKEQYTKYTTHFDSLEKDDKSGYNIKSFIRDEGITKDNKVLSQDIDTFMNEINQP